MVTDSGSVPRADLAKEMESAMVMGEGSGSEKDLGSGLDLAMDEESGAATDAG